MKKAMMAALLLVTVSMVSLTAGVLLGKSTNHTPVTVTRLPEMTAATTPRPSENTPEAQEDVSPDHNLINLNDAGLSDLMQLPGVGEKIAQRILAYREENGPFRSVEELLLIHGIGETKLENIRKHATIGG